MSSCLQAVEDVNVTFEDQQKINKFARNTSRMTELKNEIEAKKVSTECCEYHTRRVHCVFSYVYGNLILKYFG